jgi:hypothetical protein
MKTGKICFVGLDNLSMLAREFNHRCDGGAQVQQSLLACAFTRKGYDVSMVVVDYGQADGATWQGAGHTRPIAPKWACPWCVLCIRAGSVCYLLCGTCF